MHSSGGFTMPYPTNHCYCDTLLQVRALVGFPLAQQGEGSNPTQNQVFSSVTFGDQLGISVVKGGLDTKSGSMVYQPH
jgi:hypothetical protein